MTTKQGKSYVQSFRMNEDEYADFLTKFHNSKCCTKGEFVRYCIFHEWMIIPQKELIEDTKECLKIVKNIASNVNQIAIRANSTGAVYKQDKEEILQGLDTAKKECEEIWQLLKSYLSKLLSVMP